MRVTVQNPEPYSGFRALRNLGLWGHAPFLRVSPAAARRYTPFLRGRGDRYTSVTWPLQPPVLRAHFGHSPEHQLAEAQTDLATVRDAMEATDQAMAQQEQEAAYGVTE